MSSPTSNRPPSVAYMKPLSPAEKRAKLAEKEAKQKALREQKAREEAARLKVIKQRELERDHQRKAEFHSLVQQNKKQFTQLIAQKRTEKSPSPTNLAMTAAEEDSAARPPVKVGFMFTECRGPLKGLKVTDVARDGAAYQAGIEVGDIIKSIQNKLIQSVEDYAYVARSFKPRQTIPFVVYRNGAMLTCLIHFGGALLVSPTVKAGGANMVRARRASVTNPVTGKTVGLDNGQSPTATRRANSSANRTQSRTVQQQFQDMSVQDQEQEYYEENGDADADAQPLEAEYDEDVNPLHYPDDQVYPGSNDGQQGQYQQDVEEDGYNNGIVSGNEENGDASVGYPEDQYHEEHDNNASASYEGDELDATHQAAGPEDFEVNQ